MAGLKTLLRGLGPRINPDSVRRLAATSVISDLLAEGEAQALKERRELRAELAAVPAQFKDAQGKATAAVVAADKRLAAAHAELTAAIKAQAKASGESMALSYRVDMITRALMRKLTDGADPRLAVAINHCRQMGGDVSNAANRRYPLLPEVWAKFEAARNLAYATAERFGQLQLEAVSVDEVTAALQAASAELHQAFAAMNEGHLVQMAEALATVEAPQ
ncbi:hypothetical protein BurJ1DRAFT_2553 [Burkholderiales bacterium JOSHI_001]|nr:hypothetical protein BurJ1DRAFT_2553 [Burkholderiales bacterium JOSHI_001]